MSNLKMALLALAAPVGACVTRGSGPEPSVPAGYNFAYEASQQEDLGLVQAFDDGSHTYLEFREQIPQLDIRTNSSGPALKIHLSERYVTVDGVYPRLLVTADDRTANILNEAAPQPATPIPEPQSSRPVPVAANQIAEPAPSVRTIAEVGVPETLQSMHSHLRVAELNREIAQLEDRVRSLTQQLDEAHRAGAAVNLSARPELAGPRFVVRFEDNSAEARIDEEFLAPLGAAARAANRIYLHGHTDAYTATDSGKELAIRRAVAVRQLLIAQDVSPSRVRLFYRGAGNFVANNSTSEGKAQNRRVEIELRKW